MLDDTRSPPAIGCPGILEAGAAAGNGPFGPLPRTAADVSARPLPVGLCPKAAAFWYLHRAVRERPAWRARGLIIEAMLRKQTRQLPSGQPAALHGVGRGPRLTASRRRGDRTPPCITMSMASSRSPLVANEVPTLRAGLAVRGAACCPAAGLAHAVALAVGRDDVVVVHEPVEQADGGTVRGQEPAPFLERPVAAIARLRRS